MSKSFLDGVTEKELQKYPKNLVNALFMIRLANLLSDRNNIRLAKKYYKKAFVELGKIDVLNTGKDIDMFIRAYLILGEKNMNIEYQSSLSMKCFSRCIHLLTGVELVDGVDNLRKKTRFDNIKKFFTNDDEDDIKIYKKPEKPKTTRINSNATIKIDVSNLKPRTTLLGTRKIDKYLFESELKKQQESIMNDVTKNLETLNVFSKKKVEAEDLAPDSSDTKILHNDIIDENDKTSFQEQQPIKSRLYLIWALSRRGICICEFEEYDLAVQDINLMTELVVVLSKKRVIPDYEKAYALASRGRVYYEIAQYESAIESYQQAYYLLRNSGMIFEERAKYLASFKWGEMSCHKELRNYSEMFDAMIDSLGYLKALMVIDEGFLDEYFTKVLYYFRMLENVALKPKLDDEFEKYLQEIKQKSLIFKNKILFYFLKTRVRIYSGSYKIKEFVNYLKKQHSIKANMRKEVNRLRKEQRIKNTES